MQIYTTNLFTRICKSRYNYYHREGNTFTISQGEILVALERRKAIHKEVKKNPSLYCCDRIGKTKTFKKITMTKITNMSKNDLIKSIEKAENLLNNKRWIKQNTKFWLGVYINHLAKLRAELKKRG